MEVLDISNIWTTQAVNTRDGKTRQRKYKKNNDDWIIIYHDLDDLIIIYHVNYFVIPTSWAFYENIAITGPQLYIVLQSKTRRWLVPWKKKGDQQR